MFTSPFQDLSSWHFKELFRFPGKRFLLPHPRRSLHLPPQTARQKNLRLPTFSSYLTFRSRTYPKTRSRPAHADSAAATQTPSPPPCGPPRQFRGPWQFYRGRTQSRLVLPRYPIRDGAGRWLPQPISANHDPGESSRREAREKAIGRWRNLGRSVARAPPTLPSSARRQLLFRPERERIAGGRSCIYLDSQRGLVGPAPLLLTVAPSEWWPSALWLADWARCFPFYWSWWTCSTKVSPALTWREERAPGSGAPGVSLPVSGRESPGGSGGGARAGDSAAGPGPESAQFRVCLGKSCRDRRTRGRVGGFGVRSRVKGVQWGCDFWSVMERRALGQSSGLASRDHLLGDWGHCWSVVLGGGSKGGQRGGFFGVRVPGVGGGSISGWVKRRGQCWLLRVTIALLYSRSCIGVVGLVR